mmetsp:Transcript_130159/g.290583  ORF Transcript_130159/g.290583 Transcript_130159/m.290583 type:complete len:216 (-) Transcript_130159:174-821(-)
MLQGIARCQADFEDPIVQSQAHFPRFVRFPNIGSSMNLFSLEHARACCCHGAERSLRTLETERQFAALGPCERDELPRAAPQGLAVGEVTTAEGLLHDARHGTEGAIVVEDSPAQARQVGQGAVQIQAGLLIGMPTIHQQDLCPLSSRQLPPSLLGRVRQGEGHMAVSAPEALCGGAEECGVEVQGQDRGEYLAQDQGGEAAVRADLNDVEAGAP